MGRIVSTIKNNGPEILLVMLIIFLLSMFITTVTSCSPRYKWKKQAKHSYNMVGDKCKAYAY